MAAKTDPQKKVDLPRKAGGMPTRSRTHRAHIPSRRALASSSGSAQRAGWPLATLLAPWVPRSAPRWGPSRADTPARASAKSSIPRPRMTGYGRILHLDPTCKRAKRLKNTSRPTVTEVKPKRTYGTEKFETIEDELESAWHGRTASPVMPWSHVRGAVKDSYQAHSTNPQSGDVPEVCEEDAEDLDD